MVFSKALAFISNEAIIQNKVSKMLKTLIPVKSPKSPPKMQLLIVCILFYQLKLTKDRQLGGERDPLPLCDDVYLSRSRLNVNN